MMFFNNKNLIFFSSVCILLTGFAAGYSLGVANYKKNEEQRTIKVLQSNADHLTNSLAFEPAQTTLQHILRLDSDNRVAQYQLGIVYTLNEAQYDVQNDFPTAAKEKLLELSDKKLDKAVQDYISSELINLEKMIATGDVFQQGAKDSLNRKTIMTLFNTVKDQHKQGNKSEAYRTMDTLISMDILYNYADLTNMVVRQAYAYPDYDFVLYNNSIHQARLSIRANGLDDKKLTDYTIHEFMRAANSNMKHGIISMVRNYLSTRP